jgi:hypothetical protein
MRASPLRKLTDADIDVLAERIGRHVPQREIAAELGIAQSNVSRLQRRPDVAARVRVVREREAARKRQAAKRRRDRESRLPSTTQAERDALHAARLRASMEQDRYSLARGPRAGTEFPYIDSKGRYWAHPLVLYTGVRHATRRDYTANNWTVPLNFEDQPEHRFGPTDAPPRLPIGWQEPTVRMVETSIGPYGPIQVGHPVPESDVEARLAEGWELA